MAAAAAWGSPAAAQLAPIQADAALLQAPRRLQLQVRINGRPTDTAARFTLTPPDRLSAARGDLQDVGVRLPGAGSINDTVFLDQVPGLRYRYDAPNQRIDFMLTDAQRMPRTYDGRGHQEPPPPAQTDWGASVNYTLYASSLYASSLLPHFSGVNAALDARAFGPYGTLSQTAIAGNTVASTQNYLRLDTTYSFAAPDLALVGRVGDTISGGLAWTRPIRFGGLQLQRDFTLRPDLVTQPIPVVSGSAAVPSTVDVYLGSLKAFSQNVAAGPYQIVNLPVLTGTGNARVVVSDATGRQEASTLAFNNTPALLGAGLSDFSLDAGFARRFYGVTSYDYDNRPLGSASGRYGLTDRLTLEGHAEGGAGGINGGAGADVGFGPFGTLSGALSASRFGAAQGLQIYGDYSVQAFGVALDLSTQRSFGAYGDLASATASFPGPTLASVGASVAGENYVPGLLAIDVRPPRILDRVSISSPIPFDTASLSLSFINLENADRVRSRVVSASLSRPLPFHATAALTLYADLSRRGSAGAFVGVSVPLGTDIQVTTSASYAESGGTAGGIEAQKTLQHEAGSYGWRLQDQEGAAPYRSATGSYRSSYGTATAEMQQLNGKYGASAELDGSIVAIGGAVVPGNRIDDSFAVVDTGIPGVPVMQDNRPIGTTDLLGRLLVPDLRSYARNRIAIDPTSLAAGVDADATGMVLSPANHGGAYLDFGVRKDPRAAMVVVTGVDGKPLPPGSRAHLEGSAKNFVIGFDGQAYVHGLADDNVIVAENGETECRAAFAYRAAPDKRTVLGPVVCR